MLLQPAAAAGGLFLRGAVGVVVADGVDASNDL
jgi:hypothetical protein